MKKLFMILFAISMMLILSCNEEEKKDIKYYNIDGATSQVNIPEETPSEVYDMIVDETVPEETYDEISDSDTYWYVQYESNNVRGWLIVKQKTKLFDAWKIILIIHNQNFKDGADGYTQIGMVQRVSKESYIEWKKWKEKK